MASGQICATGQRRWNFRAVSLFLFFFFKWRHFETPWGQKEKKKTTIKHQETVIHSESQGLWLALCSWTWWTWVQGKFNNTITMIVLFYHISYLTSHTCTLPSCIVLHCTWSYHIVAYFIALSYRMSCFTMYHVVLYAIESSRITLYWMNQN